MRLRDNLKKQFDMTRDNELWGKYKKARNDCNNSIPWAKRHYFTTSFDAAHKDPKKTWQLINDLTARKQRNECNIKKIVMVKMLRKTLKYQTLLIPILLP